MINIKAVPALLLKMVACVAIIICYLNIKVLAPKENLFAVLIGAALIFFSDMIFVRFRDRKRWFVIANICILILCLLVNNLLEVNVYVDVIKFVSILGLIASILF